MFSLDHFNPGQKRPWRQDQHMQVFCHQGGRSSLAPAGMLLLSCDCWKRVVGQERCTLPVSQHKQTNPPCGVWVDEETVSAGNGGSSSSLWLSTCLTRLLSPLGGVFSWYHRPEISSASSHCGVATQAEKGVSRGWVPTRQLPGLTWGQPSHDPA